MSIYEGNQWLNLVSKLAPKVISIPRSTCFHEILSFETQNLMENKLLSHKLSVQVHNEPCQTFYSELSALSYPLIIKVIAT